MLLFIPIENYMKEFQILDLSLNGLEVSKSMGGVDGYCMYS